MGPQVVEKLSFNSSYQVLAIKLKRRIKRTSVKICPMSGKLFSNFISKGDDGN